MDIWYARTSVLPVSYKVDGLSSELAQVTSKLEIANDDISEKCDKIESLQWKNTDLEKEVCAKIILLLVS